MASSNSSANTPNATAEGGQDSTTVQIKNIPPSVATGEVLALFQSLIGEIRCFQEIRDVVQRTGLQITFYQREIAMKALCMKGYSIGGANLDVVSSPGPLPRSRRNMDDRRNLYALGLPFALTKAEFCALFSRYGTVVHSVILATVDNSSRRRGFVVMSSHEEAKRALAGLSRTQIKGHTIEVSWAVVQRSQGFLDGGDRAMLLDPRVALTDSPNYADRPSLPSSGSEYSEYSTATPRSESGFIRPHSAVPTTSLLITNLPAMLFSQDQDLHPLLCPYGTIDRMQLVQNRDADTVSAFVQFSTSEAAIEARNSLNGQAYDSLRQVEVRFVPPSFGDSDGDKILLDLAHNSQRDVTPRNTTARAPSPFFAADRVPTTRNGETFHAGSFPSFNTMYGSDSTTPPTRSRTGSPRTIFLSNQSRRMQGNFNNGGFATFNN